MPSIHQEHHLSALSALVEVTSMTTDLSSWFSSLCGEQSQGREAMKEWLVLGLHMVNLSSWAADLSAALKAYWLAGSGDSQCLE